MADEQVETTQPSLLALEALPKSTGGRKAMEKPTHETKIKRKRKYSFTKTKHGSNEHGNAMSSTRMKSMDDSSSRAEANFAIDRAIEVQSNLESAFPSFIKTLLRSHCQDRYRMGLPGYFTRQFLPLEDSTLILEDEDGKCYETKYFIRDGMLGAGWRQFCHAHQLGEGDVLVFQLVQPTKLKVFIVKIDNLNEVDGALGLLGLDTCAKRSNADNDQAYEEACEPGDRCNPKSRALSCTVRNKKKSLPEVILEHSQDVPEDISEHSQNQSEEVGSEVLEGSKWSAPDAPSEVIGSLEDFKIKVNGKVMDLEFHEDVRKKYYELCLCQGTFLHASIIEGISDQLVVSSISETVSVADAIRACVRKTARVMAWNRTLKALEMLGMNVGFLRQRVKRLMSLHFDCENAERRYELAQGERTCVDEEIRKMEKRVKEIKEGKEKFSTEVESMKLEAENLRLKFQEEATAPW
ncbi:hypothetical protein SAY87_005788 [Trapa incisa]|uniref:TF-B3 domain-containing protein n=1 Tax=Trapa incisa TaxID=236973 RepID=A0AAN7QC96_9MYRT|nr:hypothetical protein SAY87_005788 [Trapa incisa]